MREVAIVGAGELGGALAHLLARRDVAHRIRLIDAAGGVAAGKALDIAQAGPIEGFAAQITGSTELSDAAAATVVVIGDRVGSPETADETLMLVRQLAGFAPRAVIVCATASARELVERGTRELKLPRRRIFGTAPEALAAGAKALTALELNCSPADIGVTILGVPPTGIIVPWNDATVAGLAASRVLDDTAMRRLTARLPLLWPPGPYALAAAAARAIDGLFGRSRRICACFVAPDDSEGRRRRCAALPVRLGSEGIVEVVTPTLAPRELVALDNAMML